MRLAGAALLAAAGLLCGLTAAGRLRARQRRCEALCQMMALMGYELERFHTPLPELFLSLGARLTGAPGLLCRKLAAGLGKEDARFSDLWARAIEGLPPREREILAPLGQVLGRYGTQEQQAAVAECLRRMREQNDALRDAAAQRGRVYVGVCAAGGLMLAVLLI